MRMTLWSILLVMAGLILFNGCGNDDTAVVAKIADQKILAKDLREKLKEDYRNKKISALSPDEKRKTLDKMLDTRRKYLWALEKQLDTTASYRNELQIYRERAIAISQYNEVVVNKVIPEDLLRQYYDWKNTRVNALVLKLGYQESKTFKKDRTKAEALELAEQYREELMHSKNPKKDVIEHTEDQRQFALEPYQVGQFSMAADSLVFTASPGEAVGPLEFKEQILVFYVSEKELLKPKETYADSRKELLRTLRGQLREKEQKLFRQISDEYQKKYAVQVFDDAIEQFAGIVLGWGKRTDKKISDFTPEQRNIKLAEYNGKPFLSGSFIDFFGPRLARDYARFSTAEAVKNGFVMPELNKKVWMLEGVANGRDKKESVVRDIDRFKRFRLAQLVEDVLVSKVVHVSDEEVQKFYQEHLDKYIEPEKIRVWQILMKNEQTAEALARRARGGEDFEDLFEKYGEDRRSREGRFNIGYLTRSDSRFPEVAKYAFQAGPDKIIGPVPMNGNYLVIKTGELQKEHQKPFDQVKTSIHAQISNQKKKAKREELMNQIRHKFSFRVSDSILRSIS